MVFHLMSIRMQNIALIFFPWKSNEFSTYSLIPVPSIANALDMTDILKF